MRTISNTLKTAEAAKALRPEVVVDWRDSYLGRPNLALAGTANDALATDRTAVAYRSSAGELLLLKSNGAAIQFMVRNAGSLASVVAWTTLATAAVSGAQVALIDVLGTTIAVWRDSATAVKYRVSSDGGRTWGAAATLRTAAAGNELYSLLFNPASLVVAVEERTAGGGNAVLHSYSWGGASWSLIDSHVTGAARVWGGGADPGPGYLYYACDVAQTVAAGQVTLGLVRCYDIGAAAVIGTAHAGVVGGVVWRDPQLVTVGSTKYLSAVVQLPRGSGDLSDRVALVPIVDTPIDGRIGLGPPRVVGGVEDAENGAVCAGGGSIFVLMGSALAKVARGSLTGTLAVDTLRLAYGPDDERLELATRGAVYGTAAQLRVRLGFAGNYAEMGLFWLGPRVESGREGSGLAAYGLFGVLKRELQQMNVELRDAAGNPMTPGNILKLVFQGLGCTYSEDASLASDLQPAAVGERLVWTLRYGEPYFDLVSSILRWTGCEVRAGVAADGVTPTVYVFRPGSRFGPTPAAAKEIGAAVGSYVMQPLEVVSIDPERASDATVLPGGWDQQATLDWYADRQLVLDGGGAVGVTSTTRPATRALARALALADAGFVALRPALEVELWDTISVTDGAAGLSAARRLVSSAAVEAGRGQWRMRLGLGLE